MCGICGELSFNNSHASQSSIAAMLPLLAPRGPDHEGVWQHGVIALGHRRLSIIDLSPAGNQPMQDNNAGIKLVFNGVIYNYKQLRKQLYKLGYQFDSSGDSEVILKAWQEWGEECVTHFTGMFAIAIWDQKQQTLFLARDRLGIKPLYYSQDKAKFKFASTLPALLASKEVDTSINQQALHNLFTLHAVVPAPNTILNGVQKVEPGTTLTISHNGIVTRKRYWSLNYTRPSQPRSDREWQQLILDKLTEVVERHRLAADVPVGVLLSGGLDSSLLVALLAEKSSHTVPTFSIGFEDMPEEQGSEFEYSDQIVERYQTEHHKITIENNKVLEQLPNAVHAMHEPMFGQDAVAFYLLSQEVSKHIKVVQSGQGADELFAGYFWYPQMEAATGNWLQRFKNNYFDRSHSDYLAMLNPDYHSKDYSSEFVSNQLHRYGADTFMDSVLRLDITTLIVDDPVKRVDNMTMAWGLEARVPFLDHELVELAAQVPSRLKLQHGGKGILKDISRHLLPASVIDRPKGYFPMPALKYLRGNFLDLMIDTLNSKQCRERGVYNPTYIDNLVSKPTATENFTRLNGSKLWHATLLELWLQEHI